MSAVDTAQLDLMFTELRLPTFKAAWPELAERADADGWPAARARCVGRTGVADRARRRFERQRAEAQLRPAKRSPTSTSMSCPWSPRRMSTPRRRRWLDQGANLILRPADGRKSHLGAAIGWRAKTASGSYTRAPPIWCRNSRSRAANWHSRPLSARRYHLLILDESPMSVRTRPKPACCSS